MTPPVIENPLIEVRNLAKTFSGHSVIDNVSLSIEKGKTTVVLGPSGCGKTVLLKHLIVLLRPTSGEVFFKGSRIDNLHEPELAPVRRKYGFLFQSGALFDSMSVYENIAFPLEQHRVIADWEEAAKLVKHKLALVGLDGYQNYYPASLSGGQKKRVALARAIVLNPEIVLYDEPTTGLDPIRADTINELILKLARELGITSVVVTHDMNSAYKIADRIVMLHQGRIIADGSADYIRNHSNPIVQQFIQGRVSESDLEALRFGGTKYETQFEPRDFE
ncbi:MAG TPA: ABC transporter ATP-binding protein [Sedimentisphaerales bacterium]|nr:ABC transporter ATP-binding protein [Sedimentisphaerales bacterium]